jgi:ligand-binding SRPBCC domain-containing protein
MSTFEKRSQIAASPDRVFAFHELPDALERLTPPWMHAKVLRKDRGLLVGVRVEIETRIGPIKRRLLAEHVAYEKGRMFRDRQVRGPFAKWEHTHSMVPDGQGGCWLTDHVEYELPFGILGRLSGGWFARRQLDRLFAYRHQVTKAWCESPTPATA